MNTKRILIERMKDRGYTYQSLASKMGYATASGASERVRRDNHVTVANLLKILEAMDCDLVVRSKTSDKKEWTITLTEEDE